MNEQLNNRKVKRLNIYLTYTDKKKLTELKNKYHLSYSTIASIIAKEMYNNGITPVETLCDHYFYEDDKSSKTCIKPKFSNELERQSYIQQIGKMTMYYTNVIKLFIRNELNKHTPWEQKQIDRITSRIYNEMQNTFDPNWDGNEFNRRMPKIIKANKEYYKKLLELD